MSVFKEAQSFSRGEHVSIELGLEPIEHIVKFYVAKYGYRRRWPDYIVGYILGKMWLEL